MRALVLVSALAATMTTAVYASPKGLQNRQDPIEGDLNHCLTACLAQQGIDIHCSVASNGGNPAQCLCNPAAEAAVTSCLSQACSSVTGAEDFAEVYPALCQYTVSVVMHTHSCQRVARYRYLR
ncbi:hypothetical protein C8Q73DRAFT_674349 [Cubamyces lactineus]|nr:hypothetical protein C8Q73DRAFT_674349 [Cubamyces lactineus]